MTTEDLKAMGLENYAVTYIDDLDGLEKTVILLGYSEDNAQEVFEEHFEGAEFLYAMLALPGEGPSVEEQVGYLEDNEED